MAVPVKPQGCSNFKLQQLGRRVGRLYDGPMRALGLRHTQYSLLSTIVKKGPLTQAVLAAEVAIDPSTLTRNLQPMIAAGWVVVTPGADARSHQVQVTPAGRELRDQAQRQWKRSQLALNARLGDSRVVQLHALIDECMDLLDAQNSLD
jgi:DNA-binding MarR family transcriptional regulator